MYDEGPRYRRSAQAAVEIINQHCDPALAKAEQFSRILYTILAAIYAAEAELSASRSSPSKP
jgi:hypothetical protein